MNIEITFHPSLMSIKEVFQMHQNTLKMMSAFYDRRAINFKTYKFVFDSNSSSLSGITLLQKDLIEGNDKKPIRLRISDAIEHNKQALTALTESGTAVFYVLEADWVY